MKASDTITDTIIVTNGNVVVCPFGTKTIPGNNDKKTVLIVKLTSTSVFKTSLAIRYDKEIDNMTQYNLVKQNKLDYEMDHGPNRFDQTDNTQKYKHPKRY
ncbi:hypothetical protein MX850_02305 [Erysipelothrix sp. Poltava]|nr:hypothetical protein MX850_02305 [Erysipelothrix sp. Poltava]